MAQRNSVLEEAAARSWAARDYSKRWMENASFSNVPGNDFRHFYPKKDSYVEEWWKERYLPHVYCHKHECRISKPELGCSVCRGKVKPAEFESDGSGGLKPVPFVEDLGGTPVTNVNDAAAEVMRHAKPQTAMDIVRAAEEKEISRLEHQVDNLTATQVNDAIAKNTIAYKDRIGGAAARKAVPLCTGVFDYFPDALLAVAGLSKVGNDQHNPGQDLHWARGKSGDECDALLRHLIDRGTVDSDGIRHSTKLAWRALANLQKELEKELDLPISRGSRPAQK